MSMPESLRLPETLTARAEDLVDGAGDWVIPPTRDAATVVLLREGDDGPEVFLMRRASTMAFAAGFYVFPGGVVDSDDLEVPVAGDAERLAEVERRFAVAPDLARALVAAAARETFEECGALIVTGDVDPDAWDEWDARRQALLSGDVAFSALLLEAGLAVNADALAPWTHWVTPEVEPRRYDTRFFIAALPEGQQARALGGEADHVHWITPQDALDRCARSELAMMPPTVEAVAGLIDHASPRDAVSAAGSRIIRPMMPTPRRAADGSIEWTLRDVRTGEEITHLGHLGGLAG